MIEAEAALLDRCAEALTLAEEALAANIAAGSPKDKIALCEANLAQAHAVFSHVFGRLFG